MKLLLLLLSFAVLSTNALAVKKIIHTEKSLYRNISVEKNNQIYCLIFETRKINPPYQTCVDKSNKKKLIFNYTKLVLSGLLYKSDAKSILVLGLGGGTLPMTLNSILPNAKITSVEIDPAVIKIAKDYFDYQESEKIITEEKDARVFVKRAAIKKQKYDWIILDAFNGDYIPEHLMTQEFLEEVKSIMSDDGIITANTFSDSKLYEYESATYHKVFNNYYNVSRGSGNRIILTTKDGTLKNMETIKRSANRLALKLATYNVRSSWLVDRFKLANKPQQGTTILTDQFSPANLLKNQ